MARFHKWWTNRRTAVAVAVAVTVGITVLIAIAAIFSGVAADPAGGGPAKPPPDTKPWTPLFTKTTPAANASSLVLTSDERKVFGWISGTKSFAGKEVAVRAGAAAGTTLVVQRDNTFTWPYKVDKDTPVTFAVGSLSATVSVGPPPKRGPSVFFVVARPAYRPGDEMQFAGFLRSVNADGQFTPIANKDVEVAISSVQRNTAACKLKLTSDASGRITGKYRFTSKDFVEKYSPWDYYSLTIPGFVGQAQVMLTKSPKTKVRLHITARRVEGVLRLRFEARDFLNKPVPAWRVRFHAWVNQRDPAEAATRLEPSVFAYHSESFGRALFRGNHRPRDGQSLTAEQLHRWTYEGIWPHTGMISLAAFTNKEVSLAGKEAGEYDIELKKAWLTGQCVVQVQGQLIGEDGSTQWFTGAGKTFPLAAAKAMSAPAKSAQTPPGRKIARTLPSDDDPALVLKTDKRMYESGQTLEGELHCRFANAKVLLTLRDSRGIRLWRTIDVKDGAVRFKQAFPADVSYGCSLVAQYVGQDGRNHIAHRIIRVMPTNRMLDISTTVPKTAEPGKDVTLKIKVNRNRPVDLVVSVYDRVDGVSGPAGVRGFYLADERALTAATRDVLHRTLGDITVADLVVEAKKILADKPKSPRADLARQVVKCWGSNASTAHPYQHVVMLLRLAGIRCATLAYERNQWLYPQDKVKGAKIRLVDIFTPGPADKNLARRWITLTRHYYDNLLVLVERHDLLSIGPSVYNNGEGQGHGYAGRRLRPDSDGFYVASGRDGASSAFWNAAIRTNDRGEATVTFKLPDSLTNWSVVVTGITDDTHVGRQIDRFRAQGRPGVSPGSSGGVEMWRGGLGWHIRWPTLSVAGVSLTIPYSVSTSRSSNRTCGSPASGFRTRTHAFAHGKLGVRVIRVSP